MSDKLNIDLMEYRPKIEEELDYGDYLSEWVRDACRLKLALENGEDPELASQEEPQTAD